MADLSERNQRYGGPGESMIGPILHQAAQIRALAETSDRPQPVAQDIIDRSLAQELQRVRRELSEQVKHEEIHQVTAAMPQIH